MRLPDPPDRIEIFARVLPYIAFLFNAYVFISGLMFPDKWYLALVCINGALAMYMAVHIVYDILWYRWKKRNDRRMYYIQRRIAKREAQQMEKYYELLHSGVPHEK